MAEPQSFGALLAKLRMARNLAQTRLAERADYDHSYISRLETGARSPSRDAVERLIRTLQSSQEEADALLEAAGYMPPSLHGVAGDPEAAAAFAVLNDPAVPDDFRTLMRQSLRLLTEAGRLAAENARQVPKSSPGEARKPLEPLRAEEPDADGQRAWRWTEVAS